MLVAMTATAREQILDAYARLIVDGGTKHATLEAVARDAGISKGGLLYHFPSKAKLAEGLARRLEELVDDDVADLTSHPLGPTERLLRTSDNSSTTFTLCYDAVSRLAMNGDDRARAALHSAHSGWQHAVEEETDDAVLARAIVLISDGLSLRSSAGIPYRASAEGREIDELIDVVKQRLLP